MSGANMMAGERPEGCICRLVDGTWERDWFCLVQHEFWVRCFGRWGP